MRDRYRWWWLLVLLAVASWVASVVVPYQFMATAPTPANNPFVTDDEYRQWIGFSVAFAVAFFGFGVFFIIMAGRARRRHHILLAAFAGDTSAMPLADIRTGAALASNVAAQPLELLWRNSRVNGVFYTLIFIVQGLAVLLSVGLTIFGLGLALVQPSHPLSIWEIVLYVAGILALAATIVGLFIAYVRLFPFLFGRPFGVTATDQGIDARTELGARIHMDWDEVRLIEAVGINANAFRRFFLYAPGKRIGWAEYMARFGADYTPAHISSSEMTLRQNALLSLVVAHTNLPPRTLTKSLQKRPATSGELRRATSVSLLLACAAILLGIAAADDLIPISPILWLKWVSIGALALAILCVIFFAMRSAFSQRAPLAYATPPSASPPAPAALGVVYTLSWRPPLGRRVMLIALGLGFAINLVPAVLLALLAISAALPGFQPPIPIGDGGDFASIGRVVLAIVHGLLGILGVGLVYGGAITATARIQADHDGLAIITGPRKRVMPWSSVQEISWGAGRDGQPSYLVKGNDPTLQISWLSGAQPARADVPGDGAMPIGADELAALVAARIGLPIRVREER